jgi:hypothetical protein
LWPLAVKPLIPIKTVAMQVIILPFPVQKFTSGARFFSSKHKTAHPYSNGDNAGKL